MGKKEERGEAPLCGCGCGKKVTWQKYRRWNKYIKGHNFAGKNIQMNQK